MKEMKLKIIISGVVLLMFVVTTFFVSCNDNEDSDVEYYSLEQDSQKFLKQQGGTIIEIRFGMKSKGRWPNNYCVPGGFACILFLTHGEPPINPPKDWSYLYYEKYGSSLYANLTNSRNVIDWEISCAYASEDEINDFLKRIEKGYIDFTEEVKIEEPEMLKSMQLDNS
ncbi:MAG: hypothetical protein Q4Q06_08115, partial [Bacteroidota bacterium]|nr:hypothetical protein [Bacteroidota bacterium]